MAKAKSDTTNNEKAITHELVVSTNIEVDKDDLLAVGMSQAEDHINAQISLAKKDAETNRKKAADLTASATKALQECADSYFAELKVSITETFKLVGLRNIEFQVAASWPSKDAKTMKYDIVRVSITAAANNNDNKSGSRANENTTLKFDQGVNTKLPKEIIELLVARDTHMAAAEQADKDQMEWKRRLSKMPSLERKYKARIAESRLKNTDEGQRLLEAMTKSITQDVLMLPGG